MKANKLNVAVAGLSLAMGMAVVSSAIAAPISSLGTLVPTIVAGAPPDSPAARVDPNLPTSPFSGVVSINIRYDGKSFICTGTLVSKRDVVSAGHCVDTDGLGHVVDLTKPGTDVRVVFNSQPTPGAPGRAVITADHVYMNPDYQGFGNCPAAVPPNPNNFCVNDDISVIHMNADAPDTAQIYSVLIGSVTTGQLDTMVGYGVSGDGVNGYTVGPDFRIKRDGQNIMDLFDTNDEQNFSATSPREVWYSDFDGGGQDTFCTYFGVCTPSLANSAETMLGGGDSGGPSFYQMWDGSYALMGNNTFSGNLFHPPTGQFGDYSGGILLYSYIPWLESVTDNRIALVPEPSTWALLLIGLGLLGFSARRRNIG